MSELITKIKELAHDVSEDYLITGKDMNESLLLLYKGDEIENDEVLKRICEFANQNVYLSLFSNPEVSNANITFDMADSAKILEDAQESEDAMKNYNTPPQDFRSSLEIVVAPEIESIDEGEKLASLNTVVEYRQVLRNLLSNIETMKTAEEHNAEISFDKIAGDAESLVLQGESLGDIAKIASRYVKENMGGDVIKIAACYDVIHKELKKKKVKVKTGFTKVSARRINEKAELLKPVRDFTFSMAKLAGLNEMEENVSGILEVFDRTIKEENVSI